MPSASKMSFGAYEIDTRAGELRKRGRRIPLAPQPIRLLTLLASAPGEVITREAIRQELWGSKTFVDFEHGLNFCIGKIRAVLGDNARKPRYIETLPRRGYRFLPRVATEDGPVRIPAPAAVGESAEAEACAHYARARKRFAQFGMTALEEARKGFQAAVDLHPDYAMAHSGLGATHAMRNVFRRDPADLQKAKTHLERAIALDAELAEPWPWLCYVYGHLQDFPRAIEAGHRGVRLQPDFVHAHYFLGLVYFMASEIGPDHYQNAAIHLLHATEVNPEWQASWFVLSSLSMHNGLYDEAERFACRLLEGGTPPGGLGFIGAELTLATVALRRGEAAAARNLSAGFFRKLEKSDHMYRDGMRAVSACILGDVEMRHGTPGDALVAYRSAWHVVQEQPRMLGHYRISIRVLSGMASAYAAGGDQKHSGPLLSRALAAAEQPVGMRQGAAGASLAETLYSLATACLRAGDTDRSLALMERAIAGGWRDTAWLEADSELMPLRKNPKFGELIRSLRALPRVQISFQQAASAASSNLR